MQGWPVPIPTDVKVAYLNALLKVGFHTLDFGSFVSPAAIPQMADTQQVLAQLEWKTSPTKLLAIVANTRGAAEAAACEGVACIGFPLSVSQTFQQRNANSSIDGAYERLSEIAMMADNYRKDLVVYLSMAFGNPYGDAYSEEDVLHHAMKCRAVGIRTISLADTIGLATPGQVGRLTARLIQALPDATIGVHLHATPGVGSEKIQAAFDAGCRRFDGAIHGIGGCPMAGDELVGNIDTVWLVRHFHGKGSLPGIDLNTFRDCIRMAETVFSD
jgi:hydroxymethylglutaryl-CoA lyase